ncbi:MAG TPA: S9 family peptidase [Steroidobacteraceae bacterium]|jgi:dipeptidyl aminopeptidase/acylaminoacyl peptidase
MNIRRKIACACVRNIATGTMMGTLLIAGGRFAKAIETAPPEKLVHRFLRVEISPNATFVASVEGDSPPGGYYPALRELVIRRVRDGAATRVALPCGHVPQCWPDSPTWTPDAKRLSFALRVPGSHSRSLYTVASDGSGLTKVLDFNGTIGELRYGADGRLAMLATADATKEVGATEAGAPIAGDLDEGTPEQRIAVVENGSLHWVSPPELYVYEYDWRPAGKGFVGTASPGNGDNNWWTAKLYAFSEKESSPRELYVPKHIRQQIAAPTVSRDGQTVAFIAGIMSDFGSTGGDVYTVPLDGGVAVNMTPGLRASATALTWRCDGRLLAKLLKGDKTQFADLGLGQRAEDPRVLGSTTDSVGTRAEEMRLACPSGLIAAEHESFTEPPEIEIGTPERWRNLTAENAGMGIKAQVRSIWWRSDEFFVQGWLTLPEHMDGKIPMVTIVHGGPAAAAVPGFSGPGLVATLLANGYAVFRPNPRGSYGQGELFTLANVRDFGHGDLRDILAGIDAAVTAAPIDATRLGITGGSYGGFMTMWAVTQTDRFKAAVAAAGISNWLSYYGQNGIDAWMLPYFGASVYEDPAVYAQSSAINFIRNVRTPTFAYVGERDIECPAPQTQEFWHALKALNVPTSIMIYPGEGHGLRDPEHVADATRRTLNWFDRYLK